jgi:hypothetical protein
MHEQLDVPFRVQGLPPPVFRTWSRIQPPLGAYNDEIDLWMPKDSELFMQQDRLISMRKVVQAKPLINEDTLAEYGRRHAGIQMLSHAIAVLDESKKAKGKGQQSHDRKNKSKRNHAYMRAIDQELEQSLGASETEYNGSENPNEDITIEQNWRGAWPRMRYQEKRRQLVQMKDDAMTRAQDVGYVFQDEESKTRSLGLEPPATIPEGLWNQCVLKGARIGNSVSTKLNYILNEVFLCNHFLSHSKF